MVNVDADRGRDIEVTGIRPGTDGPAARAPPPARHWPHALPAPIGGALPRGRDRPHSARTMNRSRPSVTGSYP